MGMKQMQYVDENEQGIGLKQMMMEQMERMKSMIDMSVPYDAKMFQEFNNEWKQQQQQQQTDDDNYKPPLQTTTEEEEEEENDNDDDDDEQERELSFKM